MWIRPYQKVEVKRFDLQKESTETELRNSSYDQKKFEYKSEQNSKFEKFQKVDVTGSLDRWKQDKTISAGFI